MSHFTFEYERHVELNDGSETEKKYFNINYN